MSGREQRVVIKVELDMSEAEKSIEHLTQKLEALRDKAREFNADFVRVTQSLSEFAWEPETKETVQSFADAVCAGLSEKQPPDQDDKRVVISVELDTTQVDQDLGELTRKLDDFRAKVREAKDEVEELSAGDVSDA